MTLSGFFKTYAFNPTMRILTYSWPERRTALLIAVVAFFVTFFLVGLWHGTTWHFVICGLLLAAGATVNQLFRALRGKRRIRCSLPEFVLKGFAGSFTLTYLCFSIMPLWLTSLNWDEAANLFGTLYGVSGLLIASLAAFAALLPIVIIAHAGAEVFSRWTLRKFTWLAPIAAGSALAIIHMYGVMFPSTEINFVYQAF